MIVLCELPNCVDRGHRDVCFLSNIMEPDRTWLAVLKVPEKIKLKDSTALSHSKNHELVSEDNPQTLLRAVSWMQASEI